MEITYTISLGDMIASGLAAGAIIYTGYLNIIVNRKKFIHELQFKKEFEVYETLWRLLVAFKNTVSQLRPMLDYFDPNETDEDRLKRRTKTANEAFNEVVYEYTYNKPFYSPEVFNTINQVLAIGFSEKIDYEHTEKYGKGKLKGEGHLKSIENLEEISNHLEQIDEAIRKRIHSPRQTEEWRIPFRLHGKRKTRGT